MKIGVIGDPHFGAGYNLGKIDKKTQLNFRLLDHIATFNSIIDEFVKSKVSLVLITGDIFDSRYPTPAQLNAFSKCIRRAIDFNLEIILLVGNHDQQRTIETTTIDVFRSMEIKGMSVYSEFDVHTICDNKTNINIITMPYRDRRMMNEETNSKAIEKIHKNLNELTKPLTGVNIGLGHLMAGKSVNGEEPDTFSINELIIPISVFSDFDMVVMGHVHKPSVLSKNDPIVLNVGSMEKVNFGEKAHKKSSVIIDTDDLGKYKIIRNNVRTLYEMNFDYSSAKKLYKSEMMKKIKKDIDEYTTKFNIVDGIIKLVIKVKENDKFYVKQEDLRSHIYGKGAKFVVPIQIKSVNYRVSVNKKITESATPKFAFDSFINGLMSETEQNKAKLISVAEKIMKEVNKK